MPDYNTIFQKNKPDWKWNYYYFSINSNYIILLITYSS